MSGTIESEELDIMLKGLFAMAGIEFDQQVQGNNPRIIFS